MNRASRGLPWLVATLAVASLFATACKLDSRTDYLGDKTPKQFGLGHAASAADIAAMNIDVSPNGAGLPAGSGTPEEGAKVFAANCAACHGTNGEGKPPYPQLIGGPKGNVDFASDAKIPRTIGNYWPYATTLYDYIRRAMPQTAPGSLSADQIYAVTAYLLEREGLVSAGTTLDAKALVAVAMPARSRFVADDRRGSLGGAHVR
ncbi:MAG TPA: cytochrome c [Gemmatimonadaceae bacterium]|jgi:cytochrome c